MIAWLVPVSVFWTLAAMYLGGAAIRIEGGGGARQLTGLLLHFVLFLLVWALLRALLQSVTGPILAVALALVAASALLPALGKLAFRVVGVRITPVLGPTPSDGMAG